MKAKGILFVVVGALILGGCPLRVINTGNSECEFRVHTDRERCRRNIRSNEEALEARREARRNSSESQRVATKAEGEDIEEIVPLGAQYKIGNP
jgi:hypothetical protein